MYFAVWAELRVFHRLTLPQTDCCGRWKSLLSNFKSPLASSYGEFNEGGIEDSLCDC